jgi:glutamine amidotransferase
MILAQGNFSTSAVFQAAAGMSKGVTANHDCPVKEHPDGWGSLWIEQGEVKTIRSSKWLAEEVDSFNFDHGNSPILAIHARHSTLPKNRGESFSHPIQKSTNAETWYIMHNGYLPTAYKKLGMNCSIFDSSEYLEYIINTQPQLSLSGKMLNSKIAHLDPGGSAANAFFMNNKVAFAYQRFPTNSPFPLYFTMSICVLDDVTYISSEVIPTLAPKTSWRPLKNGELIKLDI